MLTPEQISNRAPHVHIRSYGYDGHVITTPPEHAPAIGGFRIVEIDARESVICQGTTYITGQSADGERYDAWVNMREQLFYPLSEGMAGSVALAAALNNA